MNLRKSLLLRWIQLPYFCVCVCFFIISCGVEGMFVALVFLNLKKVGWWEWWCFLVSPAKKKKSTIFWNCQSKKTNGIHRLFNFFLIGKRTFFDFLFCFFIKFVVLFHKKRPHKFFSGSNNKK